MVTEITASDDIGYKIKRAENNKMVTVKVEANLSIAGFLKITNIDTIEVTVKHNFKIISPENITEISLKY
jgi:sulfur carrier protein ThiS